MTNEIQTFTNTEFGDLNILMIEDEPWFIGKDVASVLGYANTKDALSRLIDAQDKMIAQRSQFPTLEKIPNRGLTIINESGFYSLVMHSKLKAAKRFQRWVTAEVLPSVRKHGAYMTPETIEKALYNPDFIMDLANRLKQEQEKNKALTAANMALTGEISEWDWRTCVSALVRAFSSYRLEGNFQHGWNAYYKTLNYKLGINLRSREKSGKGLLDRVKPEEQTDAVRVAAALCTRNKIDVGEILNEINLKKYAISV